MYSNSMVCILLLASWSDQYQSVNNVCNIPCKIYVLLWMMPKKKSDSFVVSHRMFVHLIVFSIFPFLFLWHVQLDVQLTPISLQWQMSSSPHFNGEFGVQMQRIWSWGVPRGLMKLLPHEFCAMVDQCEMVLWSSMFSPSLATLHAAVYALPFWHRCR